MTLAPRSPRPGSLRSYPVFDAPETICPPRFTCCNRMKQRGPRPLTGAEAPATCPPSWGQRAGRAHSCPQEATQPRGLPHTLQEFQETRAFRGLICLRPPSSAPALMSERTVTDGLQFPASPSKRKGPIQDQSHCSGLEVAAPAERAGECGEGSWSPPPSPPLPHSRPAVS